MVTLCAIGRRVTVARVATRHPVGPGIQHLDSLAGAAVGYVCLVAG